ncbi:ABC transporter permease [Pseudarthrobacter oxydans]|uniref:ABC transporter permease n=1 Tax=Pseudarthrobacter oxydans TaxID=1671 RepID=UPI00342CF372
MSTELIEAGAPQVGERSTVRRYVGGLRKHIYLPLALACVMIAGAILTPFFFTSNNIELLLVSSATVAVLAIGQFLVVVTGGIDLSVGSIAALSAVVVGLAMKDGVPAGIAIILALLVGAIVGVINGIMVVYGRIAPFIATLAMLSIASGVAFLIQDEGGVALSNNTFTDVFNGMIGLVRTPIIIFALVLAAASFVMARSAFGRRLYAIGGNIEASRLSGLPVQRDRLAAYALSGFLAGLAGLMIAAQLSEGSARLGTGYELSAIAAVVVGGASLAGGNGNPFNSVLGALVTASIVNIMNLLGVQSELQLVITGAVILVAVFLTGGRGPQVIGEGLKKVRRLLDPKP